MDLGLAGAAAVVTGASRGIGLAIAERLLREGASVAICGRKQETLDAAVEALAPLGTVLATSVDVADHDALTEWVGASAAALGGIDIAVSNASALGGIPRNNDGWRRNFEVDVLSATTLWDAAYPSLRQSPRAAFVQISTITAVEYHGYPGGGLSYGALKAALVNWVKQLALEYAGEGIRANAVSPGPIYIDNGSWGKIKRHLPDYYDANVAKQPQGRLGEASEVANVVAFLASPAASWVTGANVVVDGGFTKGIQY